MHTTIDLWQSICRLCTLNSRPLPLPMHATETEVFPDFFPLLWRSIIALSVSHHFLKRKEPLKFAGIVIKIFPLHS